MERMGCEVMNILAVEERMKYSKFAGTCKAESWKHSMKSNDAPSSLAGVTVNTWMSRGWKAHLLGASLGRAVHRRGMQAHWTTEGKGQGRLG